jgi:hypothetical protein
MRPFAAFGALLVLVALAIRQRKIGPEANGLRDLFAMVTIATMITLLSWTNEIERGPPKARALLRTKCVAGNPRPPKPAAIPSKVCRSVETVATASLRADSDNTMCGVSESGSLNRHHGDAHFSKRFHKFVIGRHWWWSQNRRLGQT